MRNLDPIPNREGRSPSLEGGANQRAQAQLDGRVVGQRLGSLALGQQRAAGAGAAAHRTPSEDPEQHHADGRQQQQAQEPGEGHRRLAPPREHQRHEGEVQDRNRQSHPLHDPVPELGHASSED